MISIMLNFFAENQATMLNYFRLANVLDFRNVYFIQTNSGNINVNKASIINELHSDILQR